MPNDFNGSFVSITIQDMAHRDLETRTNWIFCTTCLFTWKEPFLSKNNSSQNASAIFLYYWKFSIIFYQNALKLLTLYSLKKKKLKSWRKNKSLWISLLFSQEKKANSFETMLVKTVENTKWMSQEKVKSFFKAREIGLLSLFCCYC